MLVSFIIQQVRPSTRFHCLKISRTLFICYETGSSSALDPAKQANELVDLVAACYAGTGAWPRATVVTVGPPRQTADHITISDAAMFLLPD